MGPELAPGFGIGAGVGTIERVGEGVGGGAGIIAIGTGVVVAGKGCVAEGVKLTAVTGLGVGVAATAGEVGVGFGGESAVEVAIGAAEGAPDLDADWASVGLRPAVGWGTTSGLLGVSIWETF